MRISGLLLAAVFAVGATTALAQTVAVGTCKPSLVSFPTIQQAVNASPSGVTIVVCPGTYPEQVVIGNNLTLKGTAVGNSGASIITPPAGGLVQNTASLATGNPIAAQILVKAPASSVTITDLTIDGANNGISDCSLNPIGVYYQNASGSLSHNSVLNQALTPSLNGCQSGLGIFVQSGGGGVSTVSVVSNHVANYQKNGITGNEVGTHVTVTSNTVIGQGSTTGAAENSIQIGFGATGTITKNTVGSDVWAPDTISDPGDAAAGLLVFGSAGVTITSNVVSDTQFGIAVVSDAFDALPADGAVVSKNTVSETHIFDGIDLCSNNNSATMNLVNGSDEAGIHVDPTCTGAATGNTVTKNTINSACAGIMSGVGASGNTTAPNTFYNAATLQLTGTDVCTPPLAGTRKTVTKARARFHPARP